MSDPCEALAAEAASRFRETQGLGLAPIGDLVTLIEQSKEVDVAVIDAEGGDEHGVSMTDSVTGITMIAAAVLDNPMRWRSTLAHELGHLVFEDHAAQVNGTIPDDVEHRARAFARHLLVPLEAVKRFVTAPVDMASLSRLMQTFEVSPPIAAIQLREAGLIGEELCSQWCELDVPEVATRFGWMDRYEAMQAESRQPRAPQRLLQRAIRGYVEGVVTLETLASIRGVTVNEMADELDSAGIKPTEFKQQPPRPPRSADSGPADLSWLDDLD